MNDHKLFLGSLLAVGLAVTACSGGGGGGAPGAPVETPITVGPVEGTTFTSTPLAGTAGSSFSSALAVNNNGIIVGVADSGGILAAKWSAANPALPQVPLMPILGAYSAAYGINDGDVVVGESDDGAGKIVAAHWPAGITTAVALNQTGLTGNSAAYSINTANVSVGEADDGLGNMMAVYWPSLAGAPANLQHLAPAVPGSSAYFIGSTGTIVGESYDAAGELQAVAWIPVAGVYGAPIKLDEVAGQLAGTALGVDSAGNIVGEVEVAGGIMHGVVWTVAGIVANDLGAASSVQAINNTDRIVGFINSGAGNQAAIWNRGNIADRNLIAAVSQGFGVNNASIIVGVMNNQAFVATPQ